MAFTPADLIAWIEAIKLLIELLKQLFPDDQKAQGDVAKMIIRSAAGAA